MVTGGNLGVGQVVAQGEKEILKEKLLSVIKEKKLTISGLAKKMQTSRAAVTPLLVRSWARRGMNRILDPKNPLITPGTLGTAALALGKGWRFDWIDV